MAMTESKSTATSLSFKIQIKQDGQPSKLEERKNYPFYYWNRQFFGLFNFDGWPFLNHWDFRDVMYLILKV